METMFGDFPTTELEYETPFQLLLAVLLSAQTTDIQVNKVTKDFFAVVQSPHDGAKLWEEWIKEYIKTVGLHKSKAKNVALTCQMLTGADWYDVKKIEDAVVANDSIKPTEEQYENPKKLFEKRWYEIPDSVEWMTVLPGVGVKTAKVVLSVLYGHLEVAVDTHVHRVSNRLGWVKTDLPLQTSKKLETVIPDWLKAMAHRVIIYFGRYHCKAKKPNCEFCPLQHICRHYKTIEKKK